MIELFKDHIDEKETEETEARLTENDERKIVENVNTYPARFFLVNLFSNIFV